jgi:hypothetical protein
MITKIYIGILAVSAGLMAFFTFYSWSWLQSIGMPSTAVDGYLYHDSFGWIVLAFSTVILLLIGNAILWSSRRGWALWSTHIYFTVFIIIRYFWLDQALMQFKKANGLSDGGFSIGPLLGAILVVVAAAVVFCNQFMVVQLHRQMYPPAVEIDPEIETTPEEERSTDSSIEKHGKKEAHDQF